MNRNRGHAFWRGVIIPLIALSCAGHVYAQEPGGRLERIEIFGASLAGNLSGDPPSREVVVYLPPSYDETRERRYPVVYFLHGYGVNVDFYLDVAMLDLPKSADQAITDGASEMIVVLPDAKTRFAGSLFSNSPTIGDWEGYIAEDLVGYIDEHYRTVAEPGSRGLAGHSMGGYGTIRIAMKRPGVFAALYAMSSCCLMNRAPSAAAVEAERLRPADDGLPSGPDVGFPDLLRSQIAAWAPNPDNPPLFLDWPYVDGEIQPLIEARWAANSPLVVVDQYVPILQGYRALALDVGDTDSLGRDNLRFDEALTRLKVEHSFAVYEGDHMNRVGQRFRDHVLPFFSAQLD